MRDTGSPRIDAENDFLRVRRHQTLSRLANWVRHDSHAIGETLAFGDVIDALGRKGERSLGLQVIPIDAIVGSVDKVRDFDRRFRPTSDRSRARWERLALKVRQGESFPPIEVYKLGDLYFVIDGHHRVSIARAQGVRDIEARVTEIDTVISTEGIGSRYDLESKNWGLRFLRRVPLAPQHRTEIVCTDPTAYHRLAEMIEAWACRLMHHEHAYIDKATMARRWFEDEYTPVLTMIDEAGVRGRTETGADAYLRVAAERYRLIREHDWNREVLATIRTKSRGRLRPGDRPT